MTVLFLMLAVMSNNLLLTALALEGALWVVTLLLLFRSANMPKNALLTYVVINVILSAFLYTALIIIGVKYGSFSYTSLVSPEDLTHKGPMCLGTTLACVIIFLWFTSKLGLGLGMF